GAQNFFAIELEDDSQDPVGRRMLRSHVNDELVGIKKSFVRLSELEMREIGGGIGHGLLAALDSEVDLHPLFILLDDSVILAQRMALPAIGKENAFHVRMSVELDPEHIEDFPLQPVCGGPEGSRAGE